MQMDIKIAGITREIFEAALNQAKEGRAHILGEMAKALGEARSELSAHAPRIETMQIDKSKIRDIIGTGGKVIREIVATTGAKVDIDDDGTIKIAGITKEIMGKALEQAKAGRAHILGEMNKALGSARTELSAHAPRIETIQIDKSKIRDVIGTGGKVIREIVAETGAKVDIDDEGVIKISSSDVNQIEAAKKWILGIVEEAEVGKIYNGKVVNIVDFGAFVNFMGGKDGLVHVSEMKNERVEKPTDVVKEGQEVKVKVLEIDPRGKVRLSMRVVDQETGAELEDTRPAREPREPRGDRGPREDRGGDRRGPRRDGGRGGNDRGPRGEGRGDRGPRGPRGGDNGGGDPDHMPAFLMED
jgi:polyribonucleotide nucleotidyltransferase